MTTESGRRVTTTVLFLCLCLLLVVPVSAVEIEGVNFTINNTVGTLPIDILFTDGSTVLNPLSHSWDFSDASVQPTVKIPFPDGWNWTTAPINVYRNGTTISTDFNVTDYMYTGAGKTYYVNKSVTASGDGLSWETALKTLKEGMEKAVIVVFQVAGRARPVVVLLIEPTTIAVQ